MSQTTEKKPRLTTSAMIASIAEEGQETRAAPFGHALVKLAEQRPEVVGMTADLSKYTDLHIFAQACPKRFFQMGMAEQLLMGAAGGMAKEGFIPFATTYAVFATRRAYDFIHQVIAEEHLNVKICAALPGLTTGYGPSHQATEDIAIMRGIPGMTIIDPCDAIDTEQAVPAMAADAAVVFRHNHQPSRLCGLRQDRLFVQRLNGGRVQHRHADVIFTQLFRRLQRTHGHQT